MINELPTIFEVVSGTAKKQAKEKSSITNNSSTKSKPNAKMQHVSESHTKASRLPPKVEDDTPDEEDDEEHGEAACAACGTSGDPDEFWIFCDHCEKWYHGRCVRMTPARAEHIKQYKCPNCSKRARV